LHFSYSSRCFLAARSARRSSRRFRPVRRRPSRRTPALVRHPEAGGLLIRHYPPEAYDGGAQNWMMLQDARGVIYIASTNALLEYDGVTWRRIQTPSRTTIRSMAADESGRIWVGAVGDLGYIEPDDQGETRFVSLADRLPPDVRLFEDVWRLFVSRDGVYFQTQIGLFRWADGTMKVWKPTGRIFHRAQYANDTLYIGQAGGVLMALQNDELVPVPGAESLGDEPYPIILPYDEQRLLMGTRAGGVFLYDGRTLTPFPTEADALIKANNLYRGFVLPNQAIALTTTAAGMVILDRHGRLLEQIDQQDGLLSPSVYYVMPDREGGLWLALAVGLARVEAQSPFTLFGPDDGLLAGASDLARHNGTLYIAHGQGVQYLRPHPGRPPELVRVTGVANQCWAFFEFTDPDGRVPPQLLLTASDGLYLIEGGTARAVVESLNRSFGTFVLHQSKVNPYRLWVGLADGVASVLWSDGRWINEGRVSGVNDQVRSLSRARTARCGRARRPVAGHSAVGRCAPGAPRPAAPTIDRYGAEQGLAPGGAGVVKIAGKPYVGVLGKTSSSIRHPVRSSRTRRSKLWSAIPTPASSMSSRASTDASM
jgi:hypothetical protein